jgi:segregation and condensation protein B
MNDSKIAQLTTVLFTAGDEVEMKVIAKQLDVTMEELSDLLMSARQVLRPLGFVLVSDGSAVQMAVAPEYSEWTASWQQEAQSTPLTTAALETLATVAYLGGASKAEVDFVRGVNSYFTLRTLSMRGLLSKDTNDQYNLTVDALGNLGVHSLEELPDWGEVNTQLRSQLTVDSADVVE